MSTTRDAALTEVRAASSRVAALGVELEAATEARDDAIRDALATGATVAGIVEATGLSRARVYQIRDRRR